MILYVCDIGTLIHEGGAAPLFPIPDIGVCTPSECLLKVEPQTHLVCCKRTGVPLKKKHHDVLRET